MGQAKCPRCGQDGSCTFDNVGSAVNDVMWNPYGGVTPYILAGELYRVLHCYTFHCPHCDYLDICLVDNGVQPEDKLSTLCPFCQNKGGETHIQTPKQLAHRKPTKYEIVTTETDCQARASIWPWLILAIIALIILFF